MATTEILAIGTTEGPSAEFSLVSGQTATVSLKPSPTGLPPTARAAIQFKTSAGGFIDLGELTISEPMKGVGLPGTYRVLRRGNPVSFGIDKS